MVENCAFEDKKRINRMAGQDAFLTHDCSVESKLGVMHYENFRCNRQQNPISCLIGKIKSLS